MKGRSQWGQNLLQVGDWNKQHVQDSKTLHSRKQNKTEIQNPGVTNAFLSKNRQFKFPTYEFLVFRANIQKPNTGHFKGSGREIGVWVSRFSLCYGAPHHLKPIDSKGPLKWYFQKIGVYTDPKMDGENHGKPLWKRMTWGKTPLFSETSIC